MTLRTDLERSLEQTPPTMASIAEATLAAVEKSKRFRIAERACRDAARALSQANEASALHFLEKAARAVLRIQED